MDRERQFVGERGEVDLRRRERRPESRGNNTREKVEKGNESRRYEAGFPLEKGD